MVQLERSLVAGGQEGQAVQFVDRVFIGEVGQQDFADLRLVALHGALDFRGLVQRRVVVQLDLQLALRQRIHVLDEGRQVFNVEVAGRVGAGQVPLGLCLCARAERQDDAASQQRDFLVHGWVLLCE
ncbi:hypothetical protein D3C78_1546910 [compost metagenome]